MTEVHRLGPSGIDEAGAGVEAAAAAILRGGLVVFPTDTVFALAGRPDDPSATARIFEAKRRPADLALPVLAASVEDAWTVAAPDDLSRALAREFWPGGLTLVLRRTERSAGWDLGGRPATVAVRVPADPVSRSLLARVGVLAATSANLSGLPPLHHSTELTEAFGDQVEVYLVRDIEDPPGPESAGPPRTEEASTVVDLTGPQPKMLRQGAIAPSLIRDVVAGFDPGAPSLDWA